MEAVRLDLENEIDSWKDIPKSSKYQVSVDGGVRRKLKKGGYRVLKPYSRKGKWLAVKVEIDGCIKEVYVHKIIATTFELKGLPGEVLHFKNGDIHDPSLQNLGYISRQALGKLTGAKSRRKPVAKLDSQGNVVKFYTSARECARQNYMSYQTIMDRCNGKVKSSLDLMAINTSGKRMLNISLSLGVFLFLHMTN